MGFRSIERQPSLAAIIRAASHASGLSAAEITGPCRRRNFIRARMAVVAHAVQVGYSGPQIGAALGGRDHKTIYNLRDKARVWRGRDALFDRVAERVEVGFRNPQNVTYLHERASVHAAERARWQALQVRRDPCPMCGVRGDLGCRHREAA